MTAPGHRALSRSDLEYQLPASLIATAPASPRDSARMLVLHRQDNRIEHRAVRDIAEYLSPDDLLCMNNTSVLPARLAGSRADTGGRIEGLFLSQAESRWRVLLRSNGRLRPGQRVILVGPRDESGSITLMERDGDGWYVEPAEHTSLDQVGHTPIPPYILRARGDRQVDDARDRTWYQTVFADQGLRRSVAAPTAGFHFTPELLGELSAMGVKQASVTLHVGSGTFAPISTERLEDHHMHEEAWSISTESLQLISRHKAGAGRVVAVGTTTVRVLESLPEDLPTRGVDGLTDLMIAPPWTFNHVDALLTNFHLPSSTLLALVAAMTGLDVLKEAYSEAVSNGYRFYSYGDAMLIL